MVGVVGGWRWEREGGGEKRSCSCCNSSGCSSHKSSIHSAKSTVVAAGVIAVSACSKISILVVALK